MTKIKVETSAAEPSRTASGSQDKAQAAPVAAVSKPRTAPRMVVADTPVQAARTTAPTTQAAKPSQAQKKDAPKVKVPPTRIVDDSEHNQATDDAPRKQRASSVGAASDPQTPTDAAAAPRFSAPAWVHKTFPGHENAFWGGVIALVVALMVFVFGLGRMLFVGLLVAVGVAVGQILDGDAKIIRTLRELLDNDRDQR